MNKWQKAIRDLIDVFGSSSRLTDELNAILGKDRTNMATISKIKNGQTTKVYHDLGQAILILHVKYVRKE